MILTGAGGTVTTAGPVTTGWCRVWYTLALTTSRTSQISGGAKSKRCFIEDAPTVPGPGVRREGR